MGVTSLVQKDKDYTFQTCILDVLSLFYGLYYRRGIYALLEDFNRTLVYLKRQFFLHGEVLSHFLYCKWLSCTFYLLWDVVVVAVG